LEASEVELESLLLLWNPGIDLENLATQDSIHIPKLTITDVLKSQSKKIQANHNKALAILETFEQNNTKIPKNALQGARCGIASNDWVKNQRNLEKMGIRSIDCIGLPSEALSNSFQTMNNDKLAKKYKNRSLGVQMQRDLVKDEGWNAYYITYDQNIEMPDNPTRLESRNYGTTRYLNNTLVRGGGNTYKIDDVRVPLKGKIIDYKIENGQPNDALKQLQSIDFGIGSWHGGRHLFILINGEVFEIHQTQSHTSDRLFDLRPVETDALKIWTHGLIVVPPAE
jgi:hypothetical protein